MHITVSRYGTYFGTTGYKLGCIANNAGSQTYQLKTWHFVQVYNYMGIFGIFECLVRCYECRIGNSFAYQTLSILQHWLLPVCFILEVIGAVEQKESGLQDKLGN